MSHRMPSGDDVARAAGQFETEAVDAELVRRRDLFPLPRFAVESPGRGRRVARRRAEALRANSALQVLNSMYYGTKVGPQIAPAHSLSELCEPQAASLRFVLDSVRGLGSPPSGMTSRRAREELLADRFFIRAVRRLQGRRPRFPGCRYRFFAA